MFCQEKKAPSKPQTPAQNGKGPKPNTPAKQQNKTPEKNKKDDKKTQSPKTPQTPRVFTVPEIKAKIMASVEKVCFLLHPANEVTMFLHVVRNYHPSMLWDTMGKVLFAHDFFEKEKKNHTRQ